MLKALGKGSGEQYGTVEALDADLESFLEGRPALAGVRGPASRCPLGPRGWAMVALVSVFSLGWGFLLGNRSLEEAPIEGWTENAVINESLRRILAKQESMEMTSSLIEYCFSEQWQEALAKAIPSGALPDGGFETTMSFDGGSNDGSSQMQVSTTHSQISINNTTDVAKMIEDAESYGFRDQQHLIDGLSSMARSYEEEGLPQGAVPIWRAVLDPVVELHGPSSRQYAEVLVALAKAELAAGYRDRGAGAARVEKALSLLDPDAQAPGRKALLLNELGQFASAFEVLSDGLSATAPEDRAERFELTMHLHESAFGLFFTRREFDAAVKAATLALDTLEEDYGPEEPALVLHLDVLAAVKLLQGQREEGLRLQKRSCELLMTAEDGYFSARKAPFVKKRVCR